MDARCGILPGQSWVYQCRLDQKQDRHRRTAHAGMQLGQLLPHLPTLMESLRNELDGNLLTPDSANSVHNGSRASSVYNAEPSRLITAFEVILSNLLIWAGT